MDFKDKSFLITGGTGTIGQALLRRLLEEDVSEIRIFSRDEKKQADLRRLYKDERVQFLIGDVRDRDRLFEATEEIDYIFHAAALKQVPISEENPIEVIKMNVFGADNLIDAAITNKVEKVVVVSSDKAVFPASVLGMSKALMEKVVHSRLRLLKTDIPKIVITRFGNIIASRGSFIPLIVEQIKKGEEVTITDPEMPRFLITEKEVSDLVMFACEKGYQGDVFINKSSAGKVGDIVDAVTSLYGKDANISEIEIRKGEKIYESLIGQQEIGSDEDYANFYVIRFNKNNSHNSQIRNAENAVRCLFDDFEHRTNYKINY